MLVTLPEDGAVQAPAPFKKQLLLGVPENNPIMSVDAAEANAPPEVPINGPVGVVDSVMIGVELAY